MSDTVKDAVKTDGLKVYTRSLAELVKSDAKIDKATGTVTVGADLFARSLPEGMTVEQVAAVHEHEAQFAAAGALALGELSIPAMKKNKELEQTKLSIPATGKDSFEFTFNRSRMVPDGNGGQKEKFGTSNIEFNMYGMGSSRGEIKKVKPLLAEQAFDAFGS